MNKQHELQERAMDAYSHAHNIGLELGLDVDEIIERFQAELTSVQIDPALKIRALEELYQQLLNKLIPLTIEKTIDMVNLYIASSDDVDSQQKATQTVRALEFLLASDRSWAVKAIQALQILQRTDVLFLFELKLRAGKIQTKEARYFINSLLPELRQLTDEELSALTLVELFPDATRAINYLERFDQTFDNNS